MTDLWYLYLANGVLWIGIIAYLVSLGRRVAGMGKYMAEFDRASTCDEGRKGRVA